MQAEKQLTLKITQQEIYQLNNFLFESKALTESVYAFCQHNQLPFLYLCGDNGTGKTHLSLAIAAEVEAQGDSVIYLSLAELKTTLPPDSLMSLIDADVVCFDDIEAIAGDSEWEEALFHVFNEIRLRNGAILVATLHPPKQLTIQLADLRSRLATGLVFQLHDLDDATKQQALILQAQSRGLILSDDVAQYLLRHVSRDMSSLMTLLQRLDHASLAAQRRLTIPFIREVLQLAR